VERKMRKLRYEMMKAQKESAAAANTTK